MKRILYYSLIVYFVCYSGMSLAQMHCLESVTLEKPAHCPEMEADHQKMLQAKLCDMQCGVLKTVYDSPSFEVIPDSLQQQVLQTLNFSFFYSLSVQPLLRPPIQTLS